MALSGLNAANNAVEGDAVTASVTPVTEGQSLSNISYQWIVGGTVVQTGTNDSFTPTSGDLGSTIEVLASFTVNGTAEQVTALAGTVQPPPVDDWNTSSNGDWGTASGWSDDAVPTTDAALPSLANSYTVYFTISDGTVTVNTLSSVANATLDISGGTLNVTDLTTDGPLNLSGGTLNVAGLSSTAASLTQSGGTLSGTGALTVTGSLDWSGGTMSVATDIANGATASLANYSLDLSAELQIDGQATLSNGGFTLGSASAQGFVYIASDGSLTLAGSDTDNISGSGQGGTVENAGMLIVEGTGSSISVALTNDSTGTINVESGTLDLSGGGSNSGTLEIASGAVVEITNNTFTLDTGTVVEGLGTLTIDHGTLAVDAAVSAPNVDLEAGMLSGTGALMVTGSLDWSGGTMSVATDIANGATASLANYSLDLSAELQIDGQATLSNGGFTLGSASAQGFVYIASDGSLTLAGSDTDNISGSGQGGTVENAGMLIVEGTGSSISVALTNNSTGTINVESGTLDLSGGGSNSGTLEIASGAVVEITNNTFTLDTGTVVEGLGTLTIDHGTLAVDAAVSAPNVDLEAGMLSGTGALMVTGSLDWSGGTMSVATDIANGATASLANYSLDLSAELQIDGQATLSNGGFTLGSASAQGFVYIASDGSLTLAGSDTDNISGSGQGGTVENAGMLIVEGTGSSISVALTNDFTGTINVESGTLDLSGGGSNSGTLEIASGAVVEITNNTFTLDTGTVVEGLGTLTIDHGTLAVDAAVSAPNVDLEAGMLSGTGALMVTGSLDWSGGTMSVATDIANGATASLANYSLDLSAELQIDGQATLSNGGFTLGSASAQGFVYIASDGSLTLAGSDTDNISGSGQGGTVENAGMLIVEGTGSSISVALTNDSTGTINVESGTLDLSGTVTGTGSFNIESGATLEFGGSVAPSVSVSFASNTGALEFAQAATFSGGNISGFTGSDTVDLQNIPYNPSDSVTPSGSSDLVTIIDGAQVIQLTFVSPGGTLEIGTDNQGGTLISDPPDPPAATPGVIATGGTLDLGAPSSETVTFAGDTGTLILAQPSTFSGEIAGFSGTAANANDSDVIDLAGINYNSPEFSETYNSTTGVLMVTDGTDNASLTFVDFSGTFTFESDGSSGTLIFDPPSASVSTPDGVNGTITFADADTSNTQTASFTPEGSNYVGTFSLEPVSTSSGNASVGWQFDLSNDQINLAPGQVLTQSYDVNVTDPQNSNLNVNEIVSVSIGGPGNDNFVFQPGIGADTIVNFNPQADTIELDHFANVQTIQELASLITTDAHGDAVIELGHNDSITLPGMNATELHAVLQSVVHLH